MSLLTVTSPPAHETVSIARVTGFGAVSVDPVVRSTPAGALRVDVALHNRGGFPVPVHPGQFRLRAGSGAALSPHAPAWRPRLLEAGARFACALDFLVPVGADDLWIEYAEPGGTAPQAFPVGP